MTAVLTADEIGAFLKYPTITVETVGQIFGLSRASTYDRIRSGDIPSIRMGKRIMVPTAPLRKQLGMDA